MLDKLRGYIPLDKSWIIRMGVLDLINNNNKISLFLEKNYDKLSSDLKALKKSLEQWKTGKPIEVGESGTLYRFLKFASWKLGLNKKFILSGTLIKRNICNNPKIIDWTQKQLLNLDNNTSQWASASVLLGDKERIENPPFKLKLTYEAVTQWQKDWEIKYDQTITNQVLAYLKWLKSGKMEFIPKQAEDYCFARAFGIITAEEGERLWPSLRGHESDRITEMEQALQQDKITSKDHRIVQALAMLRPGIKVKYPGCVNKSWPQFWKFLEESSNL